MSWKKANILNNKKGFSLIEIILTLAITISIAYGVIIFPPQLMQEHKEYNELIETTLSTNLIRAAITKDLSGVQAVKVDESTLKVGDSIYKFTSAGLKRDKGGIVVDLSEEVFFFELSDKILRIYNDKSSMEYSLSTSFDRGEIK